MDNETNYVEYFEREGLHFGRCFGSKSYYSRCHPENKIVFNARIYLEKTFNKYKQTKIKDWFKGQEIEIWYGDLDFTIDEKALERIADKIGTLFITRESGRLVKKILDEKSKIYK